MNPITLYMLANLVHGFDELARRILQHEVLDAMGGWGLLTLAVMQSLIAVWFAWLFYKNKFFLRV